MPHRIFYPDLAGIPAEPGSFCVVEGDDARHVAQVRRAHVGEPVELFDGAGHWTCGAIQEIRKKGLAIRLEGRQFEPRAIQPLILAAPAPKGPRADMMVEQISQLGADGWLILQTARSIVDPRENKIEKWKRAAIESAKQCGRRWLLEIEGPMTLESALARPAQRFVGDPGARPGQWLQSRTLPPSSEMPTMLFIGPEGGFAPDEQDALRTAGSIGMWLGPHILRLETAAVAGLSLLGEALNRITPL